MPTTTVFDKRSLTDGSISIRKGCQLSVERILPNLDNGDDYEDEKFDESITFEAYKRKLPRWKPIERNNRIDFDHQRLPHHFSDASEAWVSSENLHGTDLKHRTVTQSKVATNHFGKDQHKQFDQDSESIKEI